jgi:hypothetical protein
MYGVTRATTTLVGAAAAGLLIWIATQLNQHHEAGYWGIVGLMAGAGLIMALSQLLGGWTKWGMPRLSPSVFLFAFVPVAIVSLWVILAVEPHHGWFHNHVMAWSRDIHVSGLVTDMLQYIPVLAFGTGLVFGFSFDTTGPRRAVAADERRTARQRGGPTSTDRAAADEPVTAERNANQQTTGPRSRFRRQREPVASDARPVDETDSDGRPVEQPERTTTQS